MDPKGSKSRTVKSKEGPEDAMHHGQRPFAKHQKELQKTLDQLGINSTPSVPPRPILSPVAYESGQQSYENETIMSYRNQLSILVASGNCQKFLGKNLTFQEIDSMVPNQIERYYKIYVAKQASMMNENITNSVINTYSKLCSYLFNIPDEQKLSNDLKSDFLVTTEIQNWAGLLSFKLGSVMTLLSASLITFSNIECKHSEEPGDREQQSCQLPPATTFSSSLNGGECTGNDTVCKQQGECNQEA